jgi:hypothetical protein
MLNEGEIIGVTRSNFNEGNVEAEEEICRRLEVKEAEMFQFQFLMSCSLYFLSRRAYNVHWRGREVNPNLLLGVPLELFELSLREFQMGSMLTIS